jgi:hypothetical protein
MKKRHYSESRQERKMGHHSHGMDVHGGNGKNMNEGEYAGVDARRRMEREDSRMISEDHNAVANMPQQVIMRAWPSSYHGNPYPDLDDTIGGIDKQMGQDEAGMKKFRSDTKY